IQCIDERESFLSAFSALFQDYGLNFVASDESYCPGIWNSTEIRDLRLRFGLPIEPTGLSSPDSREKNFRK
ncbi:MAG: hypothetical protein ACYS74_21090, partial [Planctomycetota bacterium]